jgi:ferredoxin
MTKKIIQINHKLCVGCGICAAGCHENAIKIVKGKAELDSAHHCDGLGNCLPLCPQKAISIVEIDTPSKQTPTTTEDKNFYFTTLKEQPAFQHSHHDTALHNWPIQIRLVPVSAAYFENADLLISADCCAYAYPNMHIELIKDKVVLIGCPKLDELDYTEKLTAILAGNIIKSVTICRMEVPCCAGMEHAVQQAIKNCNKEIPCAKVTFTRTGKKEQS